MFALLSGVQEVVGVPFLYLSVFLVRRFMHVYTLPLTPDPIESRLQKGKKWNRSLTVMHITLTARHNGSPQHVPGKDRLQVMQAARGSGFFGVDSAHDVGRLSLRLVRLEWAGTLTHRRGRSPHPAACGPRLNGPSPSTRLAPVHVQIKCWRGLRGSRLNNPSSP